MSVIPFPSSLSPIAIRKQAFEDGARAVEKLAELTTNKEAIKAHLIGAELLRTLAEIAEPPSKIVP
jgi:2-phospho-L-lactate transferase/gluconeogenesis factor (CofD/UPF0052 family)